MLSIRLFFMCAGLCMLFSINTFGAVVQYSNEAAWQAAAGPYGTINFTGYPQATLITNQYADIGVTFTDGIDLIYLNSNIFLNDGAGLNGASDSITVAFTQPINAIAVEFPGHMRFKLYSNSSLVFQSVIFGGGGAGFFGGLISDIPFDSAIIDDPTGDVGIDDLHFGPPIPAPGALSVVALAIALGISRRRRA